MLVYGLGKAYEVVFRDACKVLRVHGSYLQVALHPKKARGIPVSRSDVLYTGDLATRHTQSSGTNSYGQEFIRIFPYLGFRSKH